MAQYLSDAVDYFQNLCVQHPDLQHDEAAGRRVFEVTAYEEAFSDFKTASAEKAYFVRFLLPTVTWESSSDNARKVYRPGLVVGKYCSRREGGKAAMVAAWSDAERVADDFMARMVKDSRDGHALFFHTIDRPENLRLEGDYMSAQGDGSWVAVIYLFEFGTFRCVDPNSSGVAAWLDW